MDNKSFENENGRPASPKDQQENGPSTTSLPDKKGSHVALSVSNDAVPDKPYSGMNKEDLMRFSDTPTWNNIRLACFIIFWIGWTALLVAVIAMTVTAPRCQEAPTVHWWQSSSFYQVYVRSFYDSDGDGVGDINGITAKLSHFTDLNVQGIIVSSFYRSHLTDDPASDPDFGYDVTNHTAVDDIYGTVSDVEALIAAAHDIGIKVILDFIPNHTGTLHVWFQESMNDPISGPYASYYVWEECPGTPTPSYPNKWKSIYNAEDGSGVPAWTPDGGGFDMCYLHQGLASQPDLNLRSSQVKEELERILRFWLDKGVDGFRVNSARYLVEDYDLNDEQLVNSGDPRCSVSENDTPYECYDHSMTASHDDNFDLLSEWRAIVEEYSTQDNPRILIADAKESVSNTLLYYGRHSEDGANLALNYDLLTQVHAGCNGECMGNLVTSWMDSKEEHVTTDWMTNHQDEPRLPDDVYREAHLVLKFTLPGSSILHYGEEIGMVNGNVTAECQDPAGYAGDNTFCRDKSRTPMQWSPGEYGGFSANDTIPWMPVNPDYSTVNVESLSSSGDEFNVYKVFYKMADLQVSSTAFNYGVYEEVIVTSEIYSFLRYFDGTDRYLIAMNLGNVASTQDYSQHNMVPGSATCVVSNTGCSGSSEDKVNLKNLELTPGEYVVVVWPYSR